MHRLWLGIHNLAFVLLQKFQNPWYPLFRSIGMNVVSLMMGSEQLAVSREGSGWRGLQTS